MRVYVQTSQPMSIFIEIRINYKTFYGLYDSGAQVSLMSRNLSDLIKTELKQTNVKIITAGKGSEEVVGRAMTEVKIGKVIDIAEFFVLEECSSDIILGLDIIDHFFLEQHNGRKIIQNLNGYTIPITSTGNPPVVNSVNTTTTNDNAQDPLDVTATHPNCFS